MDSVQRGSEVGKISTPPPPHCLLNSSLPGEIPRSFPSNCTVRKTHVFASWIRRAALMCCNDMFRKQVYSEYSRQMLRGYRYLLHFRCTQLFSAHCPVKMQQRSLTRSPRVPGLIYGFTLHTVHNVHLKHGPGFLCCCRHCMVFFAAHVWSVVCRQLHTSKFRMIPLLGTANKDGHSIEDVWVG